MGHSVEVCGKQIHVIIDEWLTFQDFGMWPWHKEGITSPRAQLSRMFLRFPTSLWGIHRFFLFHISGFLLSSNTLACLLTSVSSISLSGLSRYFPKQSWSPSVARPHFLQLSSWWVHWVLLFEISGFSSWNTSQKYWNCGINSGIFFKCLQN